LLAIIEGEIFFSYKLISIPEIVYSSMKTQDADRCYLRPEQQAAAQC